MIHRSAPSAFGLAPRTGALLCAGLALAACAVQAPPVVAPAEVSVTVRSELGSTTTQSPATSSTIAEQLETAEAPELACQPAPHYTTYIWLYPPWTVGTSRDLHVIVTEKTDETGAETTALALKLDVVDNSDDVLSFQWRRREVVTLQYGSATTLPAGEVSAIYGEFDLDYQLDANRFWAGVTNVEDLRSDVHTFLLQAADETGLDPASAFAFFDGLTDQEFGDRLSDDPYIYHGLEDLLLDVGDPLSYDSAVIDPYTSEEIPALGTVELTELVGEDGCVVIVDVITSDANSMDLLRNGITQIRTTMTTRYDFTTGFIHSIEFAEQTTFTDGWWKRVTTITDVTPEEPILSN